MDVASKRARRKRTPVGVRAAKHRFSRTFSPSRLPVFPCHDQSSEPGMLPACRSYPRSRSTPATYVSGRSAIGSTPSRSTRQPSVSCDQQRRRRSHRDTAWALARTVARHGKYILVTLTGSDGAMGLVSHLGMTGKWVFTKDEADTRWSRVRLHLSGGGVLHYGDLRLFWTIALSLPRALSADIPGSASPVRTR